MIDRLENIWKCKASFGKKAYNLSVLLNKGILIPGGIAISFVHYLDYMERNSQVFSKNFVDSVLFSLNGILEPYSVRSSANVEDSNRRSFAGQFVTRLGVPAEGLFEAIKDVYHSTASVSSVYSKNQESIWMGVLIQEMVESDFSGVIFTYNFIERDNDSMVLEVTKGGCGKLVSGEVNPSLYILDKNSEDIRLFEGGDQNVVLEPKSLKQILRSSKKIEDIFDSPQDIEFLFRKNRFYCLQSRDITGL